MYLWADGVYLDAGAEDERRVMLAVIGGADIAGDKDLLALEDAFGESAESWVVVFEGLRDRGLKNVAMLVADGAQGIWKAFSAVFPRAKQQRCWLHKMRNCRGQAAGEAPPDDSHAPLEDHACRNPRASRTPHREARAGAFEAISQGRGLSA